jgi:hypothetical protein
VLCGFSGFFGLLELRVFNVLIGRFVLVRL